MRQKYFIVQFDTPLNIENQELWGFRAAMTENPLKLVRKVQDYVEYLVAKDFCEKMKDKWDIDQSIVPQNRTLYTNLAKTQSIIFPSDYTYKYLLYSKLFNHAVFTNNPIHYVVTFDVDMPENEDFFITSKAQLMSF